MAHSDLDTALFCWKTGDISLGKLKDCIKLSNKQQPYELPESFFKFKPLDFVIVTAFGLNYQGRVLECIASPSGSSYYVEYAYDGKIEQRRFYEDELKPEEK